MARRPSEYANDEKKRRIPTETITFRLPSSLIEELRKDAELEKISLNTFVTKIFTNHIQWERYERKVGLLPMTKPFIKEVLNQLTDDQIANLAQRTETQNLTDRLKFITKS